MTWVWTALIVVGVVMIAVALWPSVKSRREAAGKSDDPAEPADR
ncbi:MAG TPA: hypothetical protein VGD29_25150 [Actinoplanes sp.]|jgi:hypothetical protein